MDKIDFKKVHKTLYGGRVGEYRLVTVPALQFLMIDGQGDPNTADAFGLAVEALYPLAYTLKFSCKNDLGKDYGVMPLEGRFWTDDNSAFDAAHKDRWQWTLMLMQPDFITRELVDDAAETVRRKNNPPALEHIRFESFCEGQAAQVLYIGPYTDEGPTIAALHRFIEENGGRLREHNRDKQHHEIYLSDARRVAPEKRKTIIRQPY